MWGPSNQRLFSDGNDLFRFCCFKANLTEQLVWTQRRTEKEMDACLLETPMQLCNHVVVAFSIFGAQTFVFLLRLPQTFEEGQDAASTEESIFYLEFNHEFLDFFLS